MPSSGPSGDPRKALASAARASCIARSAVTVMNALSFGFNRSTRPSTASASSTGESFRALIRRRRSSADVKHRSVAPVMAYLLLKKPCLLAGIRDAVPIHMRPRRERVQRGAIRAHDVVDFVPPRDQRVGHQRTVAAPGDGLRAHE